MHVNSCAAAENQEKGFVCDYMFDATTWDNDTVAITSKNSSEMTLHVLDHIRSTSEPGRMKTGQDVQLF